MVSRLREEPDDGSPLGPGYLGMVLPGLQVWAVQDQGAFHDLENSNQQLFIRSLGQLPQERGTEQGASRNGHGDGARDTGRTIS